MNESKLKPCPFCGGKAELKKRKVPRHKVFGCYIYGVVCKCGTQIATRVSEEYAIEYWNRRATDERAD